MSKPSSVSLPANVTDAPAAALANVEPSLASTRAWFELPASGRPILVTQSAVMIPVLPGSYTQGFTCRGAAAAIPAPARPTRALSRAILLMADPPEPDRRGVGVGPSGQTAVAR